MKNVRRLLLSFLALCLLTPGLCLAAPQKAGVLVNQYGQPVPGAALNGRYLLVYFGYTFCPDVCPATLGLMTDVLDHLGPGKQKLKALFVTIDPKRDTAPVMKAYLSHFSPDIVGLTGSPEAIAGAAAKFQVPVKPATADGQIEHGVFMYLMGPDGRLIKAFHPQTPVASIIKDVKAALQ